jgi:murein DD-endopeptidase MepM/ murein hydrolase activator NlpD
MLSGPEMIESSLTDFGLAPADAGAIAQQLVAALGAAPGEIRLDAQLSPGPEGGLSLVSLEATRNDGSGALLTASADGGGYTVESLASRLESKILSARGEMDGNSFYSSAVAAGVTDSVISDFAAAFSFDVDFQREVQPGDIFEAAFEQAYNPAGEPVGAPRLLFASLRLQSKALRLYRFKPPGQADHGWFDSNGMSNVRALMRTPLDGARVSSKFGYRIHPVHGIPKLHRGTDFAAPVGTRIYASADGDVLSAGPNRCAGNMIRIQHEKGRRTHYFHLSAFSPNVHPGVRVRQGEVIGLVGNTGTCTTGPHLHYEVWDNEQPVDPLSIETGSTGVTLTGEALEAFRQERDRIDLARAQRVE